MKRKQKRANSWTQRRVSFVTFTPRNGISLVMTMMPVRLREIQTDTVIYEGPIAATWAKLAKDERIADRDLVGVLVASSDKLFEGQINWLEQSPIETQERRRRAPPDDFETTGRGPSHGMSSITK